MAQTKPEQEGWPVGRPVEGSLRDHAVYFQRVRKVDCYVKDFLGFFISRQWHLKHLNRK